MKPATAHSIVNGSRWEQESSRSPATAATNTGTVRASIDSATTWVLPWLLLLALELLFSHFPSKASLLLLSYVESGQGGQGSGKVWAGRSEAVVSGDGSNGQDGQGQKTIPFGLVAGVGMLFPLGNISILVHLVHRKKSRPERSGAYLPTPLPIPLRLLKRNRRGRGRGTATDNGLSFIDGCCCYC